jgi:hypothetical protein
MFIGSPEVCMAARMQISDIGKSPTVLLLVDVINPLDFAGGKA